MIIINIPAIQDSLSILFFTKGSWFLDPYSVIGGGTSGTLVGSRGTDGAVRSVVWWVVKGVVSSDTTAVGSTAREDSIPKYGGSYVGL